MKLQSINDELSSRDGGAQLLCSVCNVISEAEFVLQCAHCKATCHRRCTSEGEGDASIDPDAWFCTPCTESVPAADRTCALCPLAGGILRKTDDGRWVHTACAMYVPETVFKEDGSVGVGAIPKDRRRLGCKVCGKGKEPAGAKRPAMVTSAPIQCHYGACMTSFHVFCGMRADYCFQTRYVPDGSAGKLALHEAFCLRHIPPPSSN